MQPLAHPHGRRHFEPTSPKLGLGGVWRIVVNDLASSRSAELQFEVTSNRPPVVTGFDAFRLRAVFTTIYTVTAQDPDGDPLTYTWFNATQCGKFTQQGRQALWNHPHPPCAAEEVHQAEVSVVVTDGRGGKLTCVCRGGSASG
ncbi:MAG: hypothetical protein FJ315_04315, partial [SAR202 cluster bacterium]|nr:hypothetical protein [SAR202 cluster bacterium]